MTGPSVGGTSDRWLKQADAIKLLYSVVEPNLVMENLVRGPIQEDRGSFMYLSDTTGASGDSKKQTAPLYEVGADLPRLDFSLPTVSASLMDSNGFEISVPRQVVRDGVAGEAAIQRYFGKAGYILAQQIEAAQVTAIQDGAGASTAYTPTAVWSDDTATPVTDLMGFAQEVDITGYPYRMTDGLVNKAGFYELKEYLNFVDGTQFNEGRPTGQMINRDTIYVAQADMTVHKIMDGMTDGSIIGYDANNLGAEIHTYSDPLFASTAANIKYPTIEDGKKVMKSVPNMGLHYHEYMEDNTKNTIMQFWFENKTVVTEPLSLLYDTGI
ncbi:MAG: hypothetical protein KAJ03_01790 [Gammaproteobacteria bacterium]|nr:hypothetical protein [Gammaproteobacteria bacterium]